MIQLPQPERKKLVSQKLSDIVAKEIVAYISENNIQSGEMLPSEKQLAEHFGIGRTSLREGISRLISIGLLKTIQGHGIVVKEITLDSYFQTLEESILTDFMQLLPNEIEALIQTRIVLESLACNTFLKSDRKKNLAPMYECLNKMSANIQNIPIYTEYDQCFHEKLISFSDNKIILHLYRLIQIPAKKERYLMLNAKNIILIHEDHKKILTALENNDKKVIDYLSEHLLSLLDSYTADFHASRQ